jgi:hypothetical protein
LKGTEILTHKRASAALSLSRFPFNFTSVFTPTPTSKGSLLQTGGPDISVRKSLNVLFHFSISPLVSVLVINSHLLLINFFFWRANKKSR